MQKSADASLSQFDHINYTISTQHATYENQSINGSPIKEIIIGFELDADDFIVLEPSRPIGDTIYLQASPTREIEHSITVEVRLNFTDGFFKHYSYETNNQGEVVGMFLDYWGLQQQPDWIHWNDITDQF